MRIMEARLLSSWEQNSQEAAEEVIQVLPNVIPLAILSRAQKADKASSMNIVKNMT